MREASPLAQALPLAVLRDGASLFRLESYAARAPRAPKPGDGLSGVILPYEERFVPFTDHASPLGSAFRELASASPSSARTLALATIVVLETVPAAEPPSALALSLVAPLGAVAAPVWPPSPRFDAPPKPQRPQARDLRPALGGAFALRAFCEGHGPREREAALELLSEYGYNEDRVHLSWASALAGLDPYLSYHHGGVRGMSLASLPAPFVLSLLGPSRGRPWGTVARLLGLYFELGLGEDKALRVASGRLIASHGLGASLAWLGLVRRVAKERRRPLLSLVLADPKAASAGPGVLSGKGWAELEAACDDGVYGERVAYALRACVAGAPDDGP